MWAFGVWSAQRVGVWRVVRSAQRVVNWRVVARGRDVQLQYQSGLAERNGQPKGTRRVASWSEPAAVWDRRSLAEGQIILGPALIEERETTTVLLPGWRGKVHGSGCIIASKGT